MPCKKMRAVICEPNSKPPNTELTYKKLNKQSAVIPNRGIAALFCSTGFYLFRIILVHFNGVSHKSVTAIQRSNALYIVPKTDKPRKIIPRCRSPPVLLSSQF